MNVPLPTLPAEVRATAGADEQDGLLPASATNLGMPQGKGLNLPLFVDVLSQVLPSSVLAQLNVQVPPESAIPDRSLAERERALANASVEGADTGLLPAAWGQGAWSAVVGAASRGAGQDAETSSKDDVEDQPVIPAAMGMAVPPLPAAPLVSLGLNGGLPLLSSQESMATQGRGTGLLAAALPQQGMAGADSLASMAPSMFRQPSITAVATDIAQPSSDGGFATSLSEQAPEPLVSDRTAALIQSSVTLQQAGDAAQPLALNPRQPDLWQRPLAQALGERLQVQGAQGEEQALIRLDPPSLGRVEILLRQEGGTWQVQLSATHPEVSRQLQAISETLRHELSVRQQASVTVQVTSDHLGHADGRQQRQRQDGQQPREPGRAWDGDEASQTFDLA